MIRQTKNLSERGYGVFQNAPTNLLLGAIRYRRRGLKWGIPAMLLLGGGYYYATAICHTIILREGPGPLYLLVLLFAWNALKFFWIGPVSLVQLVLVQAQERRVRRVADVGEGEGSRQMSEAPGIL